MMNLLEMIKYILIVVQRVKINKNHSKECYFYIYTCFMIAKGNDSPPPASPTQGQKFTHCLYTRVHTHTHIHTHTQTHLAVCSGQLTIYSRQNGHEVMHQGFLNKRINQFKNQPICLDIHKHSRGIIKKKKKCFCNLFICKTKSD